MIIVLEKGSIMTDLAKLIYLLEKIIKKIQTWVRYNNALKWNIVMWQPYSSPPRPGKQVLVFPH